MSYHNAARATSVLGRGQYLTDPARRVSGRALAGPPQLVAPVLGVVPRYVAPVLADYGVGDYGYLEVRPEDQLLGVGDYGFLEVRPEDQMMGLGSTGGLGAYRGVGDDAKKQALKDAKLNAMKGVLSPSLWAKLNADFGALLRPVYGVIDSIPGLSAAAKTELKTRPLDSFIDLFDPIEDIVAGAIARVNARTTNTRNFLGTVVDMRVDQPGDSRLDVSTLNLVKRLRTIQQFMVLIILDPVNLGVEIAYKASESAFHMRLQSSVLAVAAKHDAATLAKPWDGHTETEVSQAPGGAEVLGTDENGTHYRKPPGAKNGTYFVKRPSVSGNHRGTVNGYLRGMGLGFPLPAGAATEVAPPAAAVAAPAGVGWLDALIATIIAAATTAAGSAISVVTYNAIAQGGAAATNAVQNKFLSPATPVPGVAPGTGPTPPAFPVKIGPAGDPGGGASDGTQGSSSFPLVPVAIGVAFLGFLFLSGRDMKQSRRMRAAREAA